MTLSKRLFDFLFAVFAGVFLLPVACLAGFWILLVDGWPVLFVADRAGVNFEKIKIHKLRTMRNRERSGSRITSANDSRFLPGARLIRKSKIDEIPQLLDILAGRLSVVGPRPEDYSLAIEEMRANPAYQQLLSVRPGLISPGTLFYYTHMEDMLDETGDVENQYLQYELPLKSALDLVYVRNQTLGYDISLILRTVKFIVLRILGKEIAEKPREYAEGQRIARELFNLEI